MGMYLFNWPKFIWARDYNCNSSYYHQQIGSINISSLFSISVVVSEVAVCHHILSVALSLFWTRLFSSKCWLFQFHVFFDRTLDFPSGICCYAIWFGINNRGEWKVIDNIRGLCKQSHKANLLFQQYMQDAILAHWGRNKTVIILRTTFSSTFSRYEMFAFWFQSTEFGSQGSIDYLSLLVHKMAGSLPSHYLNLWLPISLMYKY